MFMEHQCNPTPKHNFVFIKTFWDAVLFKLLGILGVFQLIP